MSYKQTYIIKFAIHRLCILFLQNISVTTNGNNIKLKGSRKCVLYDWVVIRYIHAQITVKPVYKGHSRDSDNVFFMSSCPLHTGSHYMHYT